MWIVFDEYISDSVTQVRIVIDLQSLRPQADMLSIEPPYLLIISQVQFTLSHTIH